MSLKTDESLHVLRDSHATLWGYTPWDLLGNALSCLLIDTVQPLSLSTIRRAIRQLGRARGYGVADAPHNCHPPFNPSHLARRHFEGMLKSHQPFPAQTVSPCCLWWLPGSLPRDVAVYHIRQMYFKYLLDWLRDKIPFCPFSKILLPIPLQGLFSQKDSQTGDGFPS